MKKSNIPAIIFILVIIGFVIFALVSQENEIATEQSESRRLALTCTTDMATEFHIHPEIEIVINGEVQEIPTNIGIKPNCMNSIHTHEGGGIIHVESPAPADFTIGDFFAVWNKPFNQNQILDSVVDETHKVTVTVNGVEVDTFENTVMHDLDKIVISYSAREQ